MGAKIDRVVRSKRILRTNGLRQCPDQPRRLRPVSYTHLSSENLLDLGLDCDMAASVYRRNAGVDSLKPVHVLLVRYPAEAAARKALAHFQKVYLAGKSSAAGDHGVVPIEDGWTGFILSGRGLGLVFEAPDETTTRLFLESSKQALDNVEAFHE